MASNEYNPHSPARRLWHRLGLLVVALLISGFVECHFVAGSDDDDEDEAEAELVIETTEAGRINPALTVADDSRIWMSYARMAPHPQQAEFTLTSTALAVSTDRGGNWRHLAVVDEASPTALAPPDTDKPAAWTHDEPSMLYDPHAIHGDQWKLLWHRRLSFYDQGERTRPGDGWIALKQAAQPMGPWKDETKLFAGSLYNHAHDGVSGAPRFQLDRRLPAPDALGNCLEFTGPSMAARPEGIYIAMKCRQGETQGKLIVLRCTHDLAECDYLGDLLHDREASLIDTHLSGFQQPELAVGGDRMHLITTPISQKEKTSDACVVFEITDLANAELRRAQGQPAVVARVSSAGDGAAGGCGYDAASTQSGIIYGGLFDHKNPVYRLLKSGVHLPLP